eukprot:398891-Ditylum_brightwellii.AAC.1
MYYAKSQAQLLKKSKEINRVLIKEHRAYHRELANSKRPNALNYEISNLVFAQYRVKSDSKKQQVSKLQITLTGPWKIIDELQGKS